MALLDVLELEIQVLPREIILGSSHQQRREPNYWFVDGLNTLSCVERKIDVSNDLFDHEEQDICDWDDKQDY